MGNMDCFAKRQAYQARWRTTGWVCFALGLGLCEAGGGVKFWGAGDSVQRLFGILLFFGVMTTLGGCYCFYLARPVPNEPVEAPKPLQGIQRDQGWRNQTELRELRFFEKLRKQI